VFPSLSILTLLLSSAAMSSEFTQQQQRYLYELKALQGSAAKL
jgi:hypothetical protein